MPTSIGFLLVGLLLVRFGGQVGDSTDLPYGIWVGRFVGAALAFAGYETFSRIRLHRPRGSGEQASSETLAAVIGALAAGTGGAILAFSAGVNAPLSVATGGIAGILAAVFIRAAK